MRQASMRPGRGVRAAMLQNVGNHLRRVGRERRVGWGRVGGGGEGPGRMEAGFRFKSEVQSLRCHFARAICSLSLLLPSWIMRSNNPRASPRGPELSPGADSVERTRLWRVVCVWNSVLGAGVSPRSSVPIFARLSAALGCFALRVQAASYRLRLWVGVSECVRVKPGFSGTMTSLGEHVQDQARAAGKVSCKVTSQGMFPGTSWS